MAVITFFDLIEQDEFRNFVSQRLATAKKDPSFSFTNSFPPLYKYRSLSKHTINDIINETVTATSIGDFNDLFDGAIHIWGTVEERSNAAEAKWREIEEHRIAARLPESPVKHDDFVGLYKSHYKTDSRLKFRSLDYLGTYACCFSSSFDSTLMWSHYANSNTGICIEYDFNTSSANQLLKKMIFPIAYSKHPVELDDLLEDKKRKIYQYPLDASVLCAALNKAEIWSYENEWRLIFVLATAKDTDRRLPITVANSLKSIIFGYHFLKPFFYYDFKSKVEREFAEERIKITLRLLHHIKGKGIPVSVMVPSIGGYTLAKKSIEIDSLLHFIVKHFEDGEPENMRYYYVIHDELMDLIDTD